MEDQKIIQLFWNRNENAIIEVSRKYGPYCFQIANNILGNKEDVKECLNDTWLRAWEQIPPTRPQYLHLFLGRITRNLSLDRYRSQMAKKRGAGELSEVLEELEGCVADSGSVESEVNLHELQRAINQFLHRLPERDCNIFLRRYYYAESSAKIAKRFLMRQGTVDVCLARIRSKLRTFLKEEEWMDED